MWRLDEAEYNHPRVRPQIALSLLLMLYIGTRPGEFVESNAHRNSNEGLHWRDVQFMMVPDRNGQPIWRVELQMRNRKHDREREDKMYVLRVLLSNIVRANGPAVLSKISERTGKRGTCALSACYLR